MAKEKNDPTGGNDYIEQLQWRAQHRRRVPVRFEPKWKYKIVYRFPPTTLLGRITQGLTLVGLALLFIYFISSGMMSEHLEGKFFYTIVFGLIVTIIFFAIKDGTKDKHHKDDSENIDS